MKQSHLVDKLEERKIVFKNSGVYEDVRLFTSINGSGAQQVSGKRKCKNSAPKLHTNGKSV